MAGAAGGPVGGNLPEALPAPPSGDGRNSARNRRGESECRGAPDDVRCGIGRDANLDPQDDKELAEGGGDVELPYALAAKYPKAAWEWSWQYVFPAKDKSVDPRSGAVRRHHVDEQVLQSPARDGPSMSLDKVLRRSVDDNAWDEESDEVWRGRDRSSRYGSALWPRETESRQGARRSCPLSHERGDSRVRVGVRVREDHSGRRSVLLHVLVHSDLLNHKRSAIGMTGGET
jgi:hypothetical protein